MRRSTLVLLLLTLFFLLVVLPLAAAPAREPWDPTGWFAAFRPFPHATQICDQKNDAAAGGVDWQLYAVHDETSAVLAFYAQRYGSSPHEGEIEVPGPDGRHLTVYPADRIHENPECGKAPPAGTHTLIFVSRPALAIPAGQDHP
ncbi:MAG TPA: hypothetical protein VGE98_05935 [Thermoanaerobaculia bacterium]